MYASPIRNLKAILLPNDVQHSADEQQLIKQALETPIGSIPLWQKVKKGQTVAIITSDITPPDAKL